MKSDSSKNIMIIASIVAGGIVVAGLAAYFATSSGSSPLKITSAAAGGNVSSSSGQNAQGNDNNNNNNDGGDAQARQQIIEKLSLPSMPGAPALGGDSARVTIVEFGDYQCTWCMRFHANTLDQLLVDYVDTGKVRLLFKDYPINDHADRASSLAAEASYCAADQGKYWQYHHELYNNWEGENTGWVTKESLKEFATNVGVADMQEFSSCLDSGKHSGIVRENYDLARLVGLDATPSFIVLYGDGEAALMSGAYPYSTFKQVLDERLEES